MTHTILLTRNPLINPSTILSPRNYKIISCDGIDKKFICSLNKANAILVMLNDKIDSNILRKAPNLRVVSTMSAGYDNIDISYCRKHDIAVTNTPDVLTETTADLVWGLILSASRYIIESDRFTRSGKFKGWKPDLMLGKDVYGKTLGVIGAGKIGTAVIKRAVGFDMKILYYSRAKNPSLETMHGARFTTLNSLLSESDIISINCPLTDKTYHMIDSVAFSKMKNGVVLINTARGKVIDENALVRNLKRGKIFAAGLDVYHDEPNIHKELFKFSNVVLLPHIGSATIETRTKMSEIALVNIKNVLSHLPALYTVC